MNKLKNLLEFNVNSYITNDKVAKHIDLQSKTEEYDCVTFGVETDSGKVIKVYIQSDQSDDFEKALADALLDDENDLEDVFNELNQNFNIVDIVWPNDKKDDNHDKTVQDLLNNKDNKTGSESLNPNVKYESKFVELFTKKYMIESEYSTIQKSLEDDTQSTNIENNQNPSSNDIQLSGLGETIHFVLLEIGLPEKIISDNKTEIINIISKYTVNLFYDYSDRLSSLRFFKENIIRMNKYESLNESKSDDDVDISFNGQLAHYFTDKRQKQIYNLINYLGISDDIILKHGNAELFINSVINKSEYYKKTPRAYSYFLVLYKALL